MKSEVFATTMQGYQYVLHLDWDHPWPQHWLGIWQREKTAMLFRMGFAVQRIIVKPSPSREGGSHIWIHITSPRQLSDDEINMLQWLCCDHHTRVFINTLRIQRGIRVWWNKLFSRHVWKKPIPKRCQKCKLRQILYEMKKEYEEKKVDV